MKVVLLLHRWLGVPFGAMATVWFLSGIGMIYWPYPTVTPAARLARARSLDASRIRLTPVEAAAEANVASPATIRLSMIDDRPAYHVGDRRTEAIVFADTGERLRSADQGLIDRVASRWVGRPHGQATIEALAGVDQWTIQTFRAHAPLVKYSWPDGEQVYVSRASAAVVQHTTVATRLGAYAGPIPHWLYFTPLRRHTAIWSRVVIALAAGAAVTAVLGLVVGFRRCSRIGASSPDATPGRIPYTGQKRRHVVLGLVFGVPAVTWAVSGLLSMEPFPTSRAGRSNGDGDAIRTRVMQALASDVSARLARQDPREALGRLPGLDVRELEWAERGGDSFLLATLAGGATRVVPLEGPARPQVGEMRIADRVRAAAGPNGVQEIRRLSQYDAYYRDRHRLRPLPVLLVTLRDRERTRLYVDPATARVMTMYTSREWVTRWAYHALHSLDLPVLYNHRPAWDIVIVAFMVGGTALGMTSMVLGWRVLGRQLARRMA